MNLITLVVTCDFGGSGTVLRGRAFAHGAMGRRIDPSWGGLIELFLVPASAPRLVKQRLWYVLSCLWDGAYKRTLAVNR